jgi:hypothetical protein
MDIAHFELPTHWAVALMYGDESIFEDNDEDFKSYSYFIDEMERQYGQCWCIDVGDEEFFSFFHDATPFGVGGSDCYKYSFDITKRA